MKVVLKSRVQKDIQRLPQFVQDKITEKIIALVEFPSVSHLKKINGHGETYRVRMGDYRILFTVDKVALTLCVIAVGHRREIYKFL